MNDAGKPRTNAHSIRLRCSDGLSRLRRNSRLSRVGLVVLEMVVRKHVTSPRYRSPIVLTAAFGLLLLCGNPSMPARSPRRWWGPGRVQARGLHPHKYGGCVWLLLGFGYSWGHGRSPPISLLALEPSSGLNVSSKPSSTSAIAAYYNVELAEGEQRLPAKFLGLLGGDDEPSRNLRHCDSGCMPGPIR